MATLGAMTATRGIAMAITGGLIISDLPHAFNYIGIGFIHGVPLPVIYMIIIVIMGTYVLSKNRIRPEYLCHRRQFQGSPPGGTRKTTHDH